MYVIMDEKVFNGKAALANSFLLPAYCIRKPQYSAKIIVVVLSLGREPGGHRVLFGQHRHQRLRRHAACIVVIQPQHNRFDFRVVGKILCQGQRYRALFRLFFGLVHTGQ